MQVLATANDLSISSEVTISLDGDCEYFSTVAGQFAHPQDIDANTVYLPAKIPSVVSQLTATDLANADLDNFDHWYKIQFKHADTASKHSVLTLNGLITICEVYLNNKLILSAANAFHPHAVEVSQHLKTDNVLFLCFRALKPRYQTRHPRPKYITRFVNERNLRFFRTPVLGYTPGFSDATKLVGPYRSISITHQYQCAVTYHHVSTTLIDKNTGEISLQIELQFLNAHANQAQILLVDSDTHDEIFSIDVNIVTAPSGNATLRLDQARINDIHPYWPHTHGKPKRYQLILLLKGGLEERIVLGCYGFKKMVFSHQNQFSIYYNDHPIYLRGACWTPIDPNTLNTDDSTLQSRLTLLRDASINMLRIPGNMLYESDTFYEMCDALGILIYQEFAFTNFDYPEQDEAFIENIRAETQTFLMRHGAKACLTALSGGSEVYQQACMMGVKIEDIDNRIFSQVLPALVNKLAPNVPYFISSPYAQNKLPIHSGEGPCNYHGVGGYRRSFDDARLFKGKLIVECLPFAHIPEDHSLRKIWHGKMPELHSPTWKNAVPRDPGSGWDFSDITDFYLQQLFAIDPVKLRSIDQERYIKLARATLVEAVETTLSIFRANAENGRVALVWNLHDFKAGAGWGYIDILGNPKSAFYALARTSTPTTVIFVDEGLDGLAVYLAHDGETQLNCQLKISLFTEEGRVLEANEQQLTLHPRSTQRISVDYFLGRFVDSSYAYKFGPRQFIACHVEVYSEDGSLIMEKTYAQPEVTQTISPNIELTASAKKLSAFEYEIIINTNYPAFYVVLDIDDFLPSDNYFHLMPSTTRRIVIKTQQPNAKPYGRVYALNSKNAYILKIITSD